MSLIYILVITFALAGQNIIKKPYMDKTGGRGVYFFTATVSFFAMMFFIMLSGRLEFTMSMLPYSALFALCYCAATIFNVLAVANGSVSLTSLFISYSLMIPTFYGVFFLHDALSIGFVPGIALLIVSLFLINGKAKKNGISLKWIIQVSIAVVSNGMCAIVQKAYQMQFNDANTNEFMIIALFIVTLVMIIMIIIKEKKQIKSYAKQGGVLGMICGIMNGIVNLLILRASAQMSMSLLFPFISAGGIVTTYMASRFLYRERLAKTQLLGLIAGIFAVALLNI